MASINDLPNELFPFVFKHLSIIDLVRCRSVRRIWRVLVDALVVVKQLIIEGDGPNKPGSEYFWRKLAGQINPNNVIKLDVFDPRDDFKNFKIYKKLTDLTILRRLNYLRISDQSKSNCFGTDFFVFLTKFPELQLLDVRFDLDKSQVICHDNLKIIFLQKPLIDFNFCLEIDCPKLLFLYSAMNMSKIKISRPEAIEALFALIFLEDIDLSSFKSLQHLTSCYILGLDLDQLVQLPKLNEFNVILSNEFSREVNERTERKLAVLISLKNELRRDDLKITYDGKEIKSVEDLPEADSDLEFNDDDDEDDDDASFEEDEDDVSFEEDQDDDDVSFEEDEVPDG